MNTTKLVILDLKSNFNIKENDCHYIKLSSGSINLIKDYEIIKIVNSVKKILLNSIKLGGTTIKNFVVSDEKIGYFKNKLMVYGRDGMGCFKCKNKIVKITQSGRSTFFCSQCQK